MASGNEKGIHSAISCIHLENHLKRKFPSTYMHTYKPVVTKQYLRYSYFADRIY